MVRVVAAHRHATRRSFRAGLQTTIWTVVVTCVLGFAVYVIETFRYQRAGVHPIDGDPVSGPGGVQLNEAIAWVFAYIPLSAVPFGIIGAAAATAFNAASATVTPSARP